MGSQTGLNGRTWFCHLFFKVQDSRTLNIARYAWLDFLRGIAIFLVIFHHLPVHDWLIRNVSYAFTASYSGVTLFFILSGFVLYKPFFQSKPLSGKEILSFYKKRFFRIYPLFFLNCVVAWLYFNNGNAEMLISSIKTLLTISVFVGSEPFPIINFVLWSLEVEIWFSILMPLFIYFIHLYSVERVTLVIFLVSFTARLCVKLLNLTHIHFLVINNLDAFIAGFYLFNLLQTNQLNAASLKRSFLGLMSVILLSGIIYNTGFFKNRSLQTFDIIIPAIHTIIIFLYAIVILVVVKLYTKYGSVFGDWIIRMSGKICFSLYVWHSLLIPVFLDAENRLSDYIYYMTALYAISILSYYIIEKHMYAYLKKYI